MAQAEEIAAHKPSGVADQTGKYLTFELGKEEYCLKILKVQEIIGMMNITQVPKTPDFVRGVINLRGKVIPVVNLRLKFGMDSQEITDRTCIIVVQIMSDGENIIMGILVDEVSEVVDISADQIDKTPSFGIGIDTGFITGMGKVGNKVIMLLDIDKVLTAGEVEMVNEIGNQQ